MIVLVLLSVAGTTTAGADPFTRIFHGGWYAARVLTATGSNDFKMMTWASTNAASFVGLYLPNGDFVGGTLTIGYGDGTGVNVSLDASPAAASYQKAIAVHHPIGSIAGQNIDGAGPLYVVAFSAGDVIESNFTITGGSTILSEINGTESYLIQEKDTTHLAAWNANLLGAGGKGAVLGAWQFSAIHNLIGSVQTNVNPPAEVTTLTTPTGVRLCPCRSFTLASADPSAWGPGNYRLDVTGVAPYALPLRNSLFVGADVQLPP